MHHRITHRLSRYSRQIASNYSARTSIPRIVSSLLIVVSLLAYSGASAGENASNPLAAVTNTDTRYQYLKDDSTGTHLNDAFIDGAFMATPKLKIKYELHYWETNATGSSEHDWDSALVKGIYFPREGVMESGTKYRVAVGFDFIYDFDNTDKGIGTGTNQVGPFVGVALAMQSGITVIPLLQHFEGTDSDVDLSLTSARLIAIKPLEGGHWVKLDFKLPYDWDREVVPADTEIQLGTNLSDSLGLYVDGKFGVGSDRLYDWGVGVGLRFKY
jgi:hypothetical protein